MAKRGALLATISIGLLATTGFVGGGSLAAPKASHKSEKATVSKKAWFHSAPPCTALDCTAVPPLSPYPENTLHVAVNAGQETARTYLALEFELPDDNEPIGGTLELPLDTDATHGSLTPEAAHVVACVAPGKFDGERGAVRNPPEIDCEVRRSAIYNEKRASLTVDLQRFAEAWDEETETSTGSPAKWKVAVALVPSPSALAANETWRAVFPATDPPRKKAEREKTPTITATIEYGRATDEQTLPEGLFGPGSDVPPPGGSSGSDIPSGSDFGAGSDLGSDSSGGPPAPGNDSGVGSFGSAAGATEDPAAVETTPGQVAGPPGSLVGFAGPGFAYPIMWALPLAILIALAATGRALTKDLYRRGL